jgi:hypothetical protein
MRPELEWELGANTKRQYDENLFGC